MLSDLEQCLNTSLEQCVLRNCLRCVICNLQQCLVTPATDIICKYDLNQGESESSIKI